MIDKLYKLGLARINFTGGEPLIRKEIGEWINYAKQKNIKVGMNSNGHFVPARIKEIKNLDLLVLSLEGPECIHDTIRKKGSYQKVIEATEAAQRVGIKVRFAATLNKLNLNYVEDLIKTAHQYNTIVTFQPMEGYQLGSKIKNPLVPEKDQFREAVKKVLDYKRSHQYQNSIGNSLGGLNYILDYPKVPHLECAFGRIAFRIEPDGAMGPCALLNSKKLSVDLRKAKIEDIERTFNNIFLPNTKCSCGFCCQRIELNHIWNLKMQSLFEVARL